jgi:polysaccharide export outer membrane protein
MPTKSGPSSNIAPEPDEFTHIRSAKHRGTHLEQGYSPRVQTLGLFAATIATAPLLAASMPGPSGPSTQNHALRQVAVTPTPQTHSTATNTSYRLCANDTVHIRVFQEDELETSVKIGKDGSISFPLVGSVLLGGKTLSEASQTLEAALRKFCKSPQVAIRIMEYNKRRFTVLGQVNRPGTFEMPDEAQLSLLEAIGMAGGYSRIANPSKVILKRSNPNGLEQVFHLDAKRMARDSAAAPFLLKTGDTIVVEESLF